MSSLYPVVLVRWPDYTSRPQHWPPRTVQVRSQQTSSYPRICRTDSIRIAAVINAINEHTLYSTSATYNKTQRNQIHIENQTILRSNV